MCNFKNSLVIVMQLLLGACTNQVDTRIAAYGLEPVAHPEPVDREYQDASVRDSSSASSSGQNMSGLDSPFHNCMSQLYANMSQACADMGFDSNEECNGGMSAADRCSGLSRIPDPDPSPDLPDCSGVTRCFRMCLCDTCGFILVCQEEADGPHGPLCDQCHFSGGLINDLREVDLGYLRDESFKTIDDYYEWSDQQGN